MNIKLFRKKVSSDPNGYSLIELLIVLVILVSTTVLAMPLFNPVIALSDGSDHKRSPQEVATFASMRAIREAIMGEHGLLMNLGNRTELLPHDVAQLVQEEPPQRIRTRFPELTRFNPRSGLGWRGLYLQATGKNQDGKPTLIDGWGREFQLQADFDLNGEIDKTEFKYARIVSAGSNGVFETPLNSKKMVPGITKASLGLADCGDDLVLFISVPDTRQ